MSIDIPKIIYIYAIILAIMYFCIIDGNIAGDVSKFTDRQDEENAKVVLDTDYDAKKASFDFTRNLVNDINNSDKNIKEKYFDEEYYRLNSQSITKALESKLKIKDKKNNESYIEFVREFQNESGQNVYVYNILAVKKGLTYPENFNILNDENSKDKNKSIDIHVLEISPYNYVLQIPEKEF